MGKTPRLGFAPSVSEGKGVYPIGFDAVNAEKQGTILTASYNFTNAYSIASAALRRRWSASNTATPSAPETIASLSN
jgi:hypothetical protein